VQRIRFGLGRKLFAIYLGLAVVIAVALVTATLGLKSIAVDTRRVLEENREARLASRLVASLNRLSPETLEQSRNAGVLGPAISEARSALVEMAEGAERGDPSLEEHQSEETELSMQIASDLDAIESWGLGKAASLDAAIFASLAESRQLAGRLSLETDEEAHEAAEHLQRAIERLLDLFLLSGGATLGVLILGFVLVDRNLVRPLRSLREGTRRFGAGDLDRRVPVETGDEIGELAREFNAMADRLSQSHRDLEDRVEARTRQLQHAARLAGLGTLAAGIAHEVNTPLATIVSCAEGLERRARGGSLDADVQLAYLETIVREAYRAKEITSDVLAFARKDPGEIERQPVEPSLRDALRLVDRLCDERGVTLDLDLPADLPELDINRAEIRQAMVNLLKNAIEASPSAGRVRLAARRVADGVEIVVEDEGPGIPDEVRAAIFDPFFTTKPAGSGTGLGLSLVYGIVERHGGSINLDESVARGARFRMRLPAPHAMAGP
jgi:signal transduction histidine kinase